VPPSPPPSSQSNPRLLTVLRSKLRLGHYSQRTEQAYAGWGVRFVRFHRLRHARDMGAQQGAAPDLAGGGAEGGGVDAGPGAGGAGLAVLAGAWASLAARGDRPASARSAPPRSLSGFGCGSYTGTRAEPGYGAVEFTLDRINQLTAETTIRSKKEFSCAEREKQASSHDRP